MRTSTSKMQKGSILWLIIGNYDRENYDIVISDEGFNCIVSASGEIPEYARWYSEQLERMIHIWQITFFRFSGCGVRKKAF